MISLVPRNSNLKPIRGVNMFEAVPCRVGAECWLPKQSFRVPSYGPPVTTCASSSHVCRYLKFKTAQSNSDDASDRVPREKIPARTGYPCTPAQIRMHTLCMKRNAVTGSRASASAHTTVLEGDIEHRLKQSSFWITELSEGTKYLHRQDPHREALSKRCRRRRREQHQRQPLPHRITKVMVYRSICNHFASGSKRPRQTRVASERRCWERNATKCEPPQPPPPPPVETSRKKRVILIFINPVGTRRLSLSRPPLALIKENSPRTVCSKKLGRHYGKRRIGRVVGRVSVRCLDPHLLHRFSLVLFFRRPKKSPPQQRRLMI